MIRVYITVDKLRSLDKKDLLVVFEHDKEYDFLSKFIWHEVFVTETVDEINLLVISENVVELLTNVLPWTRVELGKQHLILLLETVKIWGIDLLTDFEIGRFRNKNLLRTVQL